MPNKKEVSGKRRPSNAKEVTTHAPVLAFQKFEFWLVCMQSHSYKVHLLFLSNLTWFLKYFLVHFVNLVRFSV